VAPPAATPSASPPSTQGLPSTDPGIVERPPANVDPQATERPPVNVDPGILAQPPVDARRPAR
jgi:hypothetical protein